MVKPEVKKKLRKQAEERVKLRKQEKLVQKAAFKRNNKINRSKLLDDLKKCQLDAKQIELMHSTSSMQTAGFKKFAQTDLKLALHDEIKDSQPAVYVEVNRLPEVIESRSNLPIIAEEQVIMESIRYNDVVIISGETGSGKTTQLPQFLYEAGYALNNMIIGVTEPRRVAAVSMSDRVGYELNAKHQVSYQIRYSGNISEATRIKFMTDGVLLKECQKDFLLAKYSVIIIDEAHERSVFSDILIGLLSRIVLLRRKKEKPLKLIIMSATLRVQDFIENKFLFKNKPPVINVESRQYPVTVKFSKTTPDDYLKAVYRKVCNIHAKLPHGGILVFVTSQADVKVLCDKLRQKFPSNEINYSKDSKTRNKKLNRIKSNTHSGLIALDNFAKDVDYDLEEEDNSGFTRTNLHEWDHGSDSEDEDEFRATTNEPLHCLELYAMLPIEQQKLVFHTPPQSSRLCVIATNVAETSITIPNIKYVIDSGKEKTKVYNLTTGVSKFVTKWTSKASAEQRAGRAGRLGAGFCFRLYSSAVYLNDFAEFAEPKILQIPVEDILLQMKTMNIDNVVNFPFPSRPSLDALKAAEKKLILLGALDDSNLKVARFKDISKIEYSSRPTKLGKAMARFPIGARCSKMIVLSPIGLLPHVIALAAAMTVREMFTDMKEANKLFARSGYSRLLGDFSIMLRAIRKIDNTKEVKKIFTDNYLRPKAMMEIKKLRAHLSRILEENLRGDVVLLNKLKKPFEEEIKLLRQLVLACHCDHVAKRLADGELKEKSKEDLSKMTTKQIKGAYECKETQELVFISPDSILRARKPEYVVYRELYQSSKKTYMRDIAVIDPEWLKSYGVTW